MRTIPLFILISLSLGHAIAQQNARVATSALSSSTTDTGTLYYANRTEPPRAIEFKEGTVSSKSFTANINSYFNIPAEFIFIETETNTDNLGMRHSLLAQYYNGIPVEGMGYRVHEKNGFVTSANGRAVRSISADIQTTISEEHAFQLAVNYLQTTDTVFRSGKKLIVSKDFTFSPGSFSLAYQFDIEVSLIEHWRISIDARDGHIINKVSLVNNCFLEDPLPVPLPYGTGTGLTNYYGYKTIRVEKFDNGSSRLVGLTDNGGKIATYDFNNVSEISLALFFQYHKAYDVYSSNNTYNSLRQKPAVSAQWAAEQAYEYYFTKHNRNSFDNQGSIIKSYVHVGQNLNNAFWTHNLMAFGDGNNNNPLVDLDVVAHELTHGVTQYEAGLQYFREPGALNESFSDILGKAVEFHTFGDTATWLMAKHYREGGLRDFSNPNLQQQPDTYAGDMWYTGYEDNGGVHYNSGVQNFWFYLLCEGGSGVNDHEMNYSVNPIGIDQATNIAYRNLTEYLSRSSDYLDSRIGSLLATADLYGRNSTVYQEVDKAWDAVGVIDEPIIYTLELYDITATTVKIKGSLQPRGDTVTYHFEYGTTPDFGTASAAYEYTDRVEGIVTGLQSETKYYLRLVATNENGSSYATTEFTTISLAPLVKIKNTVDVTETTAVLHGQINPNSLPTSFYFEYGLTPDLGMVTPSYPMSDTTEYLNASAFVADLHPRQTYYYRMVADNGFASATTGSLSFFTAVKPVISSFAPVAAPIGTEVTITGENFSSVPERNLVSFGATRGIVVSSSSTEIKVKVPPGASLGPISLLDSESGLATQSVQEFVPTFTGEFTKNSLQLRVGNTDYIYQTLVQDMDGDNKADIVARHYLGFSVFQNVNQGGDITDESFIRSIFNGEYTPETLSLVDFDGNGLKDIVGRFQSGLRIYPNLSVPGYIFFGVPVDLPATAPLQDVVFNDFDLDGHIDIAGTANLPGDSSALIILRNQNPKGPLTANNFEQRYAMPLPYFVYYLYSDDLNNDGRPDLLAGAYNRSFVPILKNNSHPGSLGFEENNVYISMTDRYPQYISRDLNQDGWKDITSHSTSQIADVILMENKGTSPIELKDPVVALRDQTESVVQTGDMNGDGKVDLLIGTKNGKFVLLKNKTTVGEHLSSSSLETYGTYGLDINSTSWQTSMTVNDLNGDGRPEVIITNAYNQFRHDGYQMEIWQNAPPENCADPSLVTFNVSRNSATIVLPPNTALDQFEIDYTVSGYESWYRASSTTIYLQSGRAYQVRVRAKCYLGFTGYYYKEFVTDCVNTNSFSVTVIESNFVILEPYNLSAFEVQYSLAGKDEWVSLPQSTYQISNLSPGTTYDVRFRGRCPTLSEFKYKQFTTVCPQLLALEITDLRFNTARVRWAGGYPENIVLEYSPDNVNWILIDDTQIMSSLVPSKEYFVRGRLSCTNVDSDYIYTTFTTPCPQVTLDVDNVTPFSASVSWADDAATANYTVSYSLAAGGKVTTAQTSSTSFNIDGLEPGTEYQVAVTTQCVYAKALSLIVFSTNCYAPFDLSADAITHTGAELSWSDHFGGLPYFIDYSISGSNAWQTAQTTLTNISLSELRPGTRYEARVHINCLSQTAPYASVFFETSLYGETTLVPNPTSGKITIYPSESLIGRRFAILDNAGTRVAEGWLLDYTIDLTSVSPGMYTLRIDGIKTMKVIKH